MDIKVGLAGLVIGHDEAEINSIQKESGAIVNLVNNNTNNSCIVKANEQSSSRLETITPINTQSAEAERENEEEILQHASSLPQIIKKFYIEHNEVKTMSSKEAELYKKRKNNISLSYSLKFDNKHIQLSTVLLKPVKTFYHAFHNYPEIMAVINQQEFEEPSPIQCQAWPYIMRGHDLVITAQTGTGKTLAYILPALINLMRQPVPREQRIGPYVLILGPTRDLVIEIEEEIKKYLFGGISVHSVYNDYNRPEFKHFKINRLLNYIPDIIVATPDGLYDMVEQKAVTLEHVVYLVFDEIHLMEGLGIKDTIDLSLKQIRPDRQIIMTSSSWKHKFYDIFQKYYRLYIEDPIEIQIEKFDLTTVKGVEQTVIVLHEKEKRRWLRDFIFNKIYKKDRVIIFMNTRFIAETQQTWLSRLNISYRCISGKSSQMEKEELLADLRNGAVNIIIATNVGVRGIDIPDINLVINYDYPLVLEQYVHNVGRTGRSGRTDEIHKAITLFTQKDIENCDELIHFLKETNQKIPDQLMMMSEDLFYLETSCTSPRHLIDIEI
ncbi:Helicase superfamily 1/2, ATP-binding domain,Helicase, C-terminal,P-loop containing nucleoside [Cinara cedri]|uniref:RNA helicase n=1 Tax=Cinara cedri TaxID=506608 RepID=A0A5E4MLG8_9HEMI|nr:Helicase superfamily 1/2, ATP-binding domain,Helicase, C-terminal,P-loop containing nucleoside [Cinara cedri]